MNYGPKNFVHTKKNFEPQQQKKKKNKDRVISLDIIFFCG